MARNILQTEFILMRNLLTERWIQLIWRLEAYNFQKEVSLLVYFFVRQINTQNALSNWT